MCNRNHYACQIVHEQFKSPLTSKHQKIEQQQYSKYLSYETHLCKEDVIFAMNHA